jgi:pyruvate formate lyase activating enzyme
MDLATIFGNIFDVQRFSIHDGPGIRTTVFLKGCPLCCPWCSNPESQCALPQLLYSRSRCLQCSCCVAACPAQALTLQADAVWIDRARCIPCDECSQRCPSGAMRLVGRRTTASDVLAEVERDRVFYRHSGGGMTISGGEPLAQPDFTLALLEGARAMGVRSAVETAGLADPETVERVLGRADLILFDVKQMDAAVHASTLGDDNATILDNARLTSRLGVEMIIRVPVIPGFNNQPHQITAIGEFARLLGVSELHLLPYHNYGAAKYASLGREYGMPETVPPTQVCLGELRVELESLGLVVREMVSD